MAAVVLLVLPGCQTSEDPNGAVSASPSVGRAGTGDTPVLRDALQEARSRSRGSFTEERIEDGTVLMLHWVDYDLDASVQDHRYGVPATGSEATFEEPDLRFLIFSDRALMWNPRAAQPCGTPWVEMPPEAIAATTGMPVDEAWTSGEVAPLQLVADNLDTAVPAEPEGTFEFTVPVLDVLPASSLLKERPDVVDRLAKVVAPATVTVEDDTIAEVQTGMGEEVAAALEQPGSDEEVGELVFRWTMGPGRQGEFDEPEDVADMSCLESP